MKNPIAPFLFQSLLCPLYQNLYSTLKNCIPEYLQFKKSILLILFAFSFLNAKTQTWTNVGTPGFTAGNTLYSAQAFDGTVPYVVYQDVANSSKVSVMKYNGTSWVYVGIPGFSAGSAGITCIAVYNSTPYVAFEDFANGRQLTVMLYNGSNWVIAGSPGFSSGQIHSNISITINNGTPYVAFSTIPSGGYASVMKYDGANWVYVGAANFSAGSASSHSIVFNGTIPYVAYMDGGASYKATVKMFNGTSWVTVGSRGFSSGVAEYTKLGINNTGILFIAFQDGANANKATVMQFNGTNWVITGTAGLSSGTTFRLGLTLNGNNPAIVFSDIVNGNKATVLQFNGTSWLNVGTPAFSAHTVQFPGISIIGSTYYVSYQDAAAGGRVTMMSYTIPILPLSILSFQAIEKEFNAIELWWKTADEINVAGYEIQASVDGVNFLKAGFKASKNSNNIENYNYSLTQQNSKAYYRLKMIDKDGRFTYSNIIALITSKYKNQISIYPNPASNILYIENNGALKNAVVKITDVTGKIVLHQQYGTSSQKNIDVSGLPAGVYTLTILNDEKIISTEKFIKK